MALCSIHWDSSLNSLGVLKVFLSTNWKIQLCHVDQNSMHNINLDNGRKKGRICTFKFAVHSTSLYILLNWPNKNNNTV